MGNPGRPRSFIRERAEEACRSRRMPPRFRCRRASSIPCLAERIVRLRSRVAVSTRRKRRGRSSPSAQRARGCTSTQVWLRDANRRFSTASTPASLALPALPAYRKVRCVPSCRQSRWRFVEPSTAIGPSVPSRSCLRSSIDCAPSALHARPSRPSTHQWKRKPKPIFFSR